jgi:small subunit ribosomal protein S1
MSDQTTSPVADEATAPPAADPTMGSFDAESGVYTPREVVSDDLGEMSFDEAIAGTIVEFDDGDIVRGTVVKVDKDEVLLDIGFKSEGVIPNRELSIRNDVDPSEVVSLGEEIEALVLQKEDKEGRLVLSKKRAQYERAWGEIERLKEQGGVVGGMDGLVHVSELSWKHVDHPGSVVAVGDEIQVQVLDVDLDKERISLSLKATQQDPWQEFAGNHRVGELVYGRVTKLVPFGAFVQVGEGIEGLVHISEMSEQHVDLPEQVVTPGEELWVKIIDLDLQRRRISLSIKQAAEGGVVAAEYQEHFGEHAYDEAGNYVGPSENVSAEEAWAEYYAEYGDAATAGATDASTEAGGGDTPAGDEQQPSPGSDQPSPGSDQPSASSDQPSAGPDQPSAGPEPTPGDEEQPPAG